MLPCAGIEGVSNPGSGAKERFEVSNTPAIGVNLASVVEYCVFGFAASGSKETAHKSSRVHQKGFHRPWTMFASNRVTRFGRSDRPKCS
jgi:hypothetical protein